jgi:hypothetical protein
MKKIFLLSIQLLLMFPAYSQNETRWWFFGNRAGLHFQSNTVVPLPGVSPIYNGWASTTMADSAGNLLFYIDGGWIAYNQQHDTLANGYFKIHKGLQSCYIVRKSGSQYYIIHNDWINYKKPGIPPMLSYSIVDMTLAGGFGSVTVNHQSITPAGLTIVEKMAITRHCNKTDHWILVHKGGYPTGNNEFMAYLMSPTGISTIPVVSAVGAAQLQIGPGVNFYSAKMKISPNGKKVVGLYHNRVVELYDFDNSTGAVSNPARLDSTSVPTESMYPYPFDAEFSPDGSKLYVSYTDKPNGTYPSLWQYDLTLGSVAAIASSKIVIDSLPRDGIHGAALQLAANGKIYFTGGRNFNRFNHLAAINHPNLSGTACQYDSLAIKLGIDPNTNNDVVWDQGLPQFVSNYFEQKPAIQSFSLAGCGLASFVFPTVTAYPATGYSVYSFQWNFGDTQSGLAANTSTLLNPSHTFSSNGTYTVKLVLNYKCGTDTLQKLVQVTGLPEVLVSGRTTICKKESSVLTFSGTTSYTFNAGSLAQPSVALQPTATTIYTVSGTDATSGCTTSKQVTLNVSACLDVNQSTIGESVRIFPNPHDGRITLILLEAGEVEIVNTLGQRIYKNKLDQGTHTIDLPNENKVLFFYVFQGSSTSHFKLLSN